MAEFTGERVIPGQVDADLLNEHLARYAFAARLCRGKQVLDAGCGAGYGSAELARTAAGVLGIDRSAEAVAFARAEYAAENLRFEQADCLALQGRTDAALDSLEHALKLGYRNFAQMAKDQRLDSIRSNPRYEELVKRYAK